MVTNKCTNQKIIQRERDVVEQLVIHQCPDNLETLLDDYYNDDFTELLSNSDIDIEAMVQFILKNIYERK